MGVESMRFPDFSQFETLAQQGNFIPVYREWIADLDTPVSAWYRVCADAPYSFLLESVEGGEHLARYSFLGCDPLWVLETRGDQSTQTHREGTQETFTGNPLDVLANCLRPYQPVTLPELPPGIGGLFGFWGYEMIRWMEPRVPVHPAEATDLPDGVWMQVDQLLIFDQVKRKIWAVAYADLRGAETLQAAYEEVCDRVDTLVKRLQTPFDRYPLELRPSRHNESALGYTSNVTPQQFCQSVEKAKDYIKAGDIFQVVLSQRLSMDYRGDPFNLYRSLRLINPSPYMAYFQFKDWQIIGSSPEVMVKAEHLGDPGGPLQATVRPIAGTRPRGQTIAQDQAFERDLLQDPKEIAEHVMLVDLGRNDLGRVCVKGSVQISDQQMMVIERYSHVMHIVSNVVGQLEPSKTAWELLKACFPAGTVSGAPKIRAMEIIYELEGCRRGPYSGIYGYYDFEGQLNTAIAIRTMIVRNGTVDNLHHVSVQAGAGLVADSDPEREYEETLNKAKGLLEAIHGLNAGLPYD
jgi:anthranilate synthase component I